MKHRWKFVRKGEIPWSWRKTSPSAAMSTTDPPRTGPLSKPDRGGGSRRLPPEPWHGFAALNSSTYDKLTKIQTLPDRKYKLS